MDKYIVLLIFLPMLEIFILYKLGVHIFIFRTLKQYSDLHPDQRKFVQSSFRQEILVLSTTPLVIYAVALILDYLTNRMVPSSALSHIMLLVGILVYPNCFDNKHERVQMRRLKGVIIQLYVLLTGVSSVLVVLIFGTIFTRYLPFPPLRYVNLYSTNGLPLPKWFTLSRVLVYILPSTVYIGIHFYLANLCFLAWFRAMYYGFLKRFWWSVEDDKYVLDYFGDSDAD